MIAGKVYTALARRFTINALLRKKHFFYFFDATTLLSLSSVRDFKDSSLLLVKVKVSLAVFKLLYNAHMMICFAFRQVNVLIDGCQYSFQ